MDLISDPDLHSKIVVLCNSMNLALLSPQNDTIQSVHSEAGVNESQREAESSLSEQTCMGFTVKVCPVAYQSLECQMLTLTPLCKKQKRQRCSNAMQESIEVAKQDITLIEKSANSR